jgi:hypothetical protein
VLATPVGRELSIQGMDFGRTQAQGFVILQPGERSAVQQEVVSWSDGEIRLLLPDGLARDAVRVMPLFVSPDVSYPLSDHRPAIVLLDMARTASVDHVFCTTVCVR